jgi:hypothetical protein
MHLISARSLALKLNPADFSVSGEIRTTPTHFITEAPTLESKLEILPNLSLRNNTEFYIVYKSRFPHT